MTSNYSYNNFFLLPKIKHILEYWILGDKIRTNFDADLRFRIDKILLTIISTTTCTETILLLLDSLICNSTLCELNFSYAGFKKILPNQSKLQNFIPFILNCIGLTFQKEGQDSIVNLRRSNKKGGKDIDFFMTCYMSSERTQF